jgi:hypothetical protein
MYHRLVEQVTVARYDNRDERKIADTPSASTLTSTTRLTSAKVREVLRLRSQISIATDIARLGFRRGGGMS